MTFMTLRRIGTFDRFDTHNANVGIAPRHRTRDFQEFREGGECVFGGRLNGWLKYVRLRRCYRAKFCARRVRFCYFAVFWPYFQSILGSGFKVILNGETKIDNDTRK